MMPSQHAISIKLGINTSNWEAALGILPSETNNPYVLPVMKNASINLLIISKANLELFCFFFSL